jgi:alkylation response protein AidB-like acyl-CoA dehydrogenase
MYVEMTEERAALVEAVRDFATAELAPFAVERDRGKIFPIETLRRAGELGLGGIYVAEDVGGSGLSRLDAVAIFEELAKGDTAVAAYISIHNMVAWMIDSYGDTGQRERWLPRLCTMEDLGSYCLTEPGAGSDAGAITTAAVRDGDEYVINGVKQFISGAGTSALYVVMARTGGAGPNGISAIVVPADAPGLSFGPNEDKMGWNAQPTRQVIFDDVRVPVSNRLANEGDGFRIAMKGLNGGRVNMGACSLGGAQWALDQARRYLTERFAFGKALAENQGIVFQLADMATDVHAARLMLQRAAAAMDAQEKDVAAVCAMAKRFATDACFAVANNALQMFGGYGYLRDYGIERVVRDLRVHQILEGTNEIMRVIIGRDLLGAH